MSGQAARLLTFASDRFVLPLPEGHRFPMEKYRLLRDGLQQRPWAEIREAPRASLEDLGRVHTQDYIDRLCTGRLTPAEQRDIGFPWSPEMAERSIRSAGATVAAARAVLSGEAPLAGNLAGGTHHAYADHGEGFCCFNDVAVAARMAQAEFGLERVAILDLDVHQGNGTAAIFQDDPSVWTCSIHGENNFPFRKECSDLDIGLPDGTGDQAYLRVLEEALEAMRRSRPELVLLVAGADVLATDRLGRLSLSPAGLSAREARVVEWARDEGLPVAFCMGGGYSVPIELTVQAQLGAIEAMSCG